MVDLPARVLDAWSGTHGEVRATPELRRVVALPGREVLPEGFERTVTRALGGRGMTLWPTQAEILIAASEGGCFASVEVGGGKTAPTFLAPRAAGVDRALLLVPSKLRGKTRRDFAALAPHWPDARPREVTFDSDKVPPLILGGDGPSLHVTGYGMLSTRPDLIEEVAPQLIVLDEMHEVKNLRAACSRRLLRYLRANQCRVVGMSGTVTDRSLLDFWHLFVFTHGEDMPLPRSRAETAIWARAVDEKAEVRARPGALAQLLRPGETPSLETVREAVGRRWRDCPGVVTRRSQEVAASIRVELLRPPVPLGARPVLARLEREKIRPDGEEATPADVWSKRRQLVGGFAYLWREPGPEPWIQARRNWGRFARSILERGDPDYDTEGRVEAGCRRGALPDRAWRAWQEIRPTFVPERATRWYGDEILRLVIERCAEPTLVWVEHEAFGERLAELTGWPYYRRDGGHTASGDFVEDDPADRPAILSIGSCSDGLNLQHRWHRNFAVTPPPRGKIWEQMMGRTHRPGQREDVVTWEIIATRMGADIDQAVADAEYARAMTDRPQKLLLADWI